MYLKELIGDDRCYGPSATTRATNLEDCGFDCARIYNRKIIHFNPNGRFLCSCLLECSHNPYSTAAKQYALLTGMVILFTQLNKIFHIMCIKESKGPIINTCYKKFKLSLNEG